MTCDLNACQDSGLLYSTCSLADAAGRKLAARIVVALLPVALWPAVLTMLPHKEERFLYVTYPLVRLRHAAFDHGYTPAHVLLPLVARRKRDRHFAWVSASLGVKH